LFFFQSILRNVTQFLSLGVVCISFIPFSPDYIAQWFFGNLIFLLEIIAN